MGRIGKNILYVSLCAMMLLILETRADMAPVDVLEYYSVDYSNHTVEFDSTNGPAYTINYTNKEIISCSCENAILRKCEVDGDILTIEVYSDELPVDSTFIIDLSTQKYSNDFIEMYEFNYSDKTISFDTSRGPHYIIDYENKVILHCSSLPGDGGILKKCEVKGGILTITVYSDELPEDSTYTFDMTVPSYHNQAEDPMGDYMIDKTAEMIRFSSIQGQLYTIDYGKKVILDCSTTSAVIKNSEVNGDILTITVFSDELSEDTTYTFDMNRNLYPTGFVGNPDVIDGYEIDHTAKTICFDTSNGPEITINYDTKEVLDHTTRAVVLKECEVNGDTLTITVYSTERMVDSTYTFDMTGGGIEDVVERYEFDYSEKTISFDTSRGPAYLIDYENKEILYCSSIYEDGGILKKCEVNGDVLTITVYSDELPKDSTYTFDMTINRYPDYYVYGNPDFVLPSDTITIEESAFEGDTMTIVYLPDSCKEIGPYAFRDCWWLTQIRIPANCKIDTTAFDGCGQVYVFSTAGGQTETFCHEHGNCVFVEE